MPTVIEHRERVDFPAYRFGSDGTFWSRLELGPGRPTSKQRFGKSWKLLTGKVRSDGRVKVTISNEIVKEEHWLGRLLLEVFVGECPDGMECCHNDGNPGNCWLDNLRWDTHLNNILDKINHGTHGFKLVEAQVVEIIDLCHSKVLSDAELSKKFKVSISCIRAITRGWQWKHLTDGKAVPTKPKEKLTEENVLTIRARSYNETGAALAKEFGVSAAVVSLIVHRKLWKHLS